MQDTTAPTVETFTMSDDKLKIGDSSTVTLRFSEQVSGFSSSDDILIFYAWTDSNWPHLVK